MGSMFEITNVLGGNWGKASEPDPHEIFAEGPSETRPARDGRGEFASHVEDNPNCPTARAIAEAEKLTRYP